MSALAMVRRLSSPAMAVIVLTTVVTGTVSGQGFTFVGTESTLPFPDVIEQPDEISCGPTSAAMVLKYYGIDAGIGPLKTAAGTRWFEAGNIRIGMTLPRGIENALESRGLGAGVYRGGLRDLISAIDAGKPAILLVRSGRGTWHYIVVTGYQNGGDTFRIHDPGGVVYWISGRDLNQTWQFSGDLRSDGRGRGWSEYIPDLRCDVCAGSGRVNAPNPNLECPVCSGSGRVKLVVDTPFGRVEKGFGSCGACGGSGRLRGELPKVNCLACGGRGTIGDPQRKGVEQFAAGNTMIVPNISRGRKPVDSVIGANGQPIPNSGGSEFNTRQLRVVNNTGGPLEVWLQYYADGRWYPTPPGPNSEHLIFRLAPGEASYLNDGTRNNRRIDASSVCIRGIVGDRHWDRDWVRSIPLLQGSYRSNDMGTYTYTFD